MGDKKSPKAKTGSSRLNRFTTLRVLLDILVCKRLVFSDPKFWDDKNDTELLKIYRKRVKRKKILALCFLDDFETIHHWKAFAGGVDGCCIEFDKAKLKKLLFAHKKSGVRCFQVRYKKLGEPIDDRPDKIPFQKRWPYRYEREFRAIWEGNKDSHPIPIPNNDLSMITRITLSEKLPKHLFNTIEEFLRSPIFGLSNQVKINQTTVYENRGWIKKFETKFGTSHCGSP